MSRFPFDLGRYHRVVGDSFLDHFLSRENGKESSRRKRINPTLFRSIPISRHRIRFPAIHSSKCRRECRDCVLRT